MRGRIEGEALAPEGAAITTDHVMLLDEEHAQTFARQKVRADQSSDAGADDDRVIRIARLVF